MDYNRDRHEFIEKFKKDQKLDQSRNTSERAKSNSKEVNLNSRWDYLYQLGKVKQSKKKQLIELKEKENMNIETRECTFSPKVNKNVDQAVYKFNTEGNKSISNNNIIDRQAMWNQKKTTKIEQIKNQQINKEYEECIFRPRIVHKNLLNQNCPFKTREDIYEDAKNYLVDPESYEIYVEKQKKFRDNKKIDQEKIINTPGSGRLGTNSRITKPSAFNLLTESRDTKNYVLQVLLNKRQPKTPKKIRRNDKLSEKEIMNILYSNKNDVYKHNLESKRNGKEMYV